MSDEKEKDRKLATNRLLDILRSQQSTETKPLDVPVDVPPKDEEDGGDIKTSSLENEIAVVEQKEEKPDEEQIDETEDEQVPSVKPTKVKGITTQDLLKTLNTVQSSSSTDIKQVVEKTQADYSKEQRMVPEKSKEVKPSIAHVDKEPTSQTSTSNLLEQIQKPVEKPETKKIKEVHPIEFDSSLLSTLSDQKQKRTIQDNILSLFHLFNESSRRITIHHGENCIRLLQIKTGFKKTEIEKVKEYSLPYKTEEGQIEKSADLLRFIINEELDSKEVKYAYGAYYSTNVETKTHILQAPSLSKKELSDLVDWNAKKNIPFSPDQAIVDYEISQAAVNKGEKQNIVIGISEESSINDAIDYFSGSKLKPRLISTLPVLMWKLFLLNYPDRKSGCYILVHLGENKTTVTLVKNQQLLLTREILFGAEDFYKAAMQKVVTEDHSFKIDYSTAKQLLADYGIPDDTKGVTVGSHISLYKLSIFLRPALERLTGELNRSMKYFTKQIPDLEWTEMLFDGNCATFPNLVTELGKNLYVKVGLLNPMRKGLFHVKNDGIASNDQMSKYTINFALASENAEKINVIPKKLQSNYRYLFLYKVTAVISALVVPIYLVSVLLSGFNIKQLEKEIQARTKQWGKLSVQAKEYIGLITDIDILNGYRSFLENDRKHSINQIKILKLFSTIVPKDIKLTKIKFLKVSLESDDSENDTGNGSFKHGLEVSGFVQAEASVSDIYLTNFVMKLEHLDIFSKIDLIVDETSKSTDGKLFFSLNIRI